MSRSAVERARQRVLWHRLRHILRIGTAVGAMVLFVTVGLFGQIVGLDLPVRIGTVSIAVVIALVARLERSRPPMPRLPPLRASPIRRSATWLSWFTLVFLLAIRVPPVLVTLTALLPVLGVFVTASRYSMTPAARRTALFAPLIGHAGLIVAVLGVFGHASYWAAALGLWLAGLEFISRLSLSAWVAMHSRSGRHACVKSWLSGWTGGLVDHATQCHTLVLAGDIGAAVRLQSAVQPLAPQSVRYAMACIALQAAKGSDTQAAFEWLTQQFPTQPHGPLGMSDAVLRDGNPASEWAELAQELAGKSLLSRGLLRIADANLARSYALAKDTRAHDIINEVLDSVDAGLTDLDSATLHRLTLAAEMCAHPKADALRQRAEQVDSSGLIGHTIQTGAPPSSSWM